ncbi:hypothetical protein GMDG_00520 [Pseudogymnoascus destructans 20631-21]|uniref:Protein kinase domain-containing protein n=1 Tax=Pseudogymnoascus destructans (strain ATCC MYA-4855 / 20631-21) TaxID=658429 RepID=L8G8U0_PSED2|nr:hypothetical protein GMDG_00520 [Pseudogymnoascus destructans 20631-21]
MWYIKRVTRIPGEPEYCSLFGSVGCSASVTVHHYTKSTDLHQYSKARSSTKLPVCAKRLHTLELLGLVKFPKQKEVGFVYRLPDSIGQDKKGFPIEDMIIRKPRATIFQWEHDPVPALGLRFNLARKLVQSVSFLHASGWLHRNIRTDELYIFPKSGPRCRGTGRVWILRIRSSWVIGIRGRTVCEISSSINQPNQQIVYTTAK